MRAVVLLIVLLAIGAPWIAPHDPNETDLLRRLQPPVWLEGGEWAFPLGCDALGRDLLSRLIYGARVSISIGAIVILFATAVGIARRPARRLPARLGRHACISRIVDILLGFPYLIFAIGLMAMMGPGPAQRRSTLIAQGVGGAVPRWCAARRWPRARWNTSRRRARSASGAVGIMLREILPNILSPVIVVATIRLAHVIILEASLSFLGLGVQPPTASWGSMVADGRDFMLDAWWVTTFAGLAILMLVLAINVASQGLRDAFDPRFHD